MNGRVYDPMLGRFGTPDPMTSEPYDSQGWNRYSYVGNDPLNFTDPSGYCRMGCFWQKPFKALGKLLRKFPIIGQIVQVAATALCVASVVCAPLAPAVAGLTSAVVTGLASGDIGQALRAGLIAAATAVAFNVVGDLTSGIPGLNVAAHAAVGCASAVASKGKCGPGALSAGVSSFAGHFLPHLGLQKDVVVRATIGGLASVAGGGKFGNGAVTAAFGYLFNEYLHATADALPVVGKSAFDIFMERLILGGTPLGRAIILVTTAIDQLDQLNHGVVLNENTKDNGSDQVAPERTSRRPSAATRRDADARATDSEGNLRCTYCDEVMTPEHGHPNSRQYDHWYPWSRGGDSGSGNINGACRTCNLGKGAQTPEEWLGTK